MAKRLRGQLRRWVHGPITIGEIPPIRRAALAAVGKKKRASLWSVEKRKP